MPISLALSLTLGAWVVLELALRVWEGVQGRGRTVSSGPYALVRHPSYTSLLLILAGFGLALGNLGSLAIGALLPLPALLLRIRVAEAELTRGLGEDYRRYQSQTERLIPGLW